jgi:hypothetical protein
MMTSALGISRHRASKLDSRNFSGLEIFLQATVPTYNFRLKKQILDNLFSAKHCGAKHSLSIIYAAA